MAEVLYQYPMVALQHLETNGATFEVVDFGTIVSHVAAFDDTTEEYLNGKLRVHADIDTSGTVTFQAAVVAKTGAASKNVALTLGHRPVNDNEAIDGAYTDEDSGDKAIAATQDNQTLATWTETVTNLGWAANDLVYFRISRPAAGANNLAGDMYWLDFSVRLPIT